MYREIWNNNYRNVCSIDLMGSTNSIIIGVTDFRVGESIMTDDLIYSDNDAKKVRITFYEQDGFTPRLIKYYEIEEFKDILPAKKNFDRLGFSLFAFENETGDSGLKLCNACGPSIGMDAVTISYQSEYNNISLKPAVISSFYKNNSGLTYIQYDGSVKLGSTGGPLIDVKSGKVIGIVANKELKVMKIYKKLIKILDSNIESLQKVEGNWNVNDIDPIQVLIANQHMIKHISREFISNSSTRVGVALDIGHLIETMESNLDFQFDKKDRGHY